MISIKDRVVTVLLNQPDLLYIPIQDNLRLQILPDVEYIPRCQRSQGAAFCKNQDMLVVWGDSVDAAEQRADKYLKQMVEVFSQGFGTYTEKEKDNVMVNEMPMDGSEDAYSGVVDSEDTFQEPRRKIVLIQAVLTALTLLLIVAAIGSGFRQIAIEIGIDHSYIRLAFVIAVPFQMWLALVSRRSSEPLISYADKFRIVLHAIYRRHGCSDDRSHTTDEAKLEVLLWHQTKTDFTERSSSHDCSMPCVQGKSRRDHHSNHGVCYGRYSNL